ncbi:hypothetical protein V6N12_046030 [Hibiscus sabdariffa]|uniref:DUF659 domain-containing protein n=1 Tax=Hibiscus sabdariffa TaxID=183260 RepID=A0ABR2G4F9_9ROSI
MATSENGPMFLKAINCYGEVKDKVFIANLMKEVIDETPCVVHTLNLALKNICSAKNIEGNVVTYDLCNWITEIHGDVVQIKKFIMNHIIVVFERFSSLKLISVFDTHFTSIIVMLKRLNLIKRGFQKMVINDESVSYREDGTRRQTL